MNAVALGRGSAVLIEARFINEVIKLNALLIVVSLNGFTSRKISKPRSVGRFCDDVIFGALCTEAHELATIATERTIKLFGGFGPSDMHTLRCIRFSVRCYITPKRL